MNAFFEKSDPFRRPFSFVRVSRSVRAVRDACRGLPRAADPGCCHEQACCPSRDDVRKDGKDHYDLVCGEGRLLAFKALGQTEVPVVVVEGSKEDLLLSELAENLARRQFTTLESARQILAMRERGEKPSDIARKVDLDVVYVNGMIRLLKHGEERLLIAVEKRQLPLSLAISISESSDQDVQRAMTDAYERGDPHAILAWLHTDERFEHWRAQGDARATWTTWLHRKHYPRTLQCTVPSYIVWKLRNIAWLPCSDGTRRPPSRLTLASNLSSELQHVLARPAIDDGHALFQAMKLDRTAVRTVLLRVGVMPNLDDLSWDDFYALLLDLPVSDPNGKAARGLYRALISRPDDMTPSGENWERFKREGKLWALRNNTGGYQPVADGVYYIDESGVPDAVLDALPKLALDRRRGATKVRRLFETRPLGTRDIKLAINDIAASPRSSDFAIELNRLKPFVYAIRLSADSRGEGRQRLQGLKVVLCNSARGVATVGKDILPLVLNEGEGLLVNDTGFLVIDSDAEAAGRILDNDLVADRLGEMLAELLGVERGSDFARLARCEPDLRVALLKRIIGDDPTSLLVEAHEKLKIPVITNDTIIAGSWVPPPPKVPMPDVQQGESTSPPAPLIDNNKIDEVPVDRSSNSVSASPVPFVASAPARIISHRVRATPSGVVFVSGRRTVDAARCEELVTRFEEAEGQNRFPLSVAHQQGRQAFGCDVLSFASESDREQFKTTSELALVARFIEVKGRSSENALIELRGNELAAARGHADRYYIYRVYEDEPGSFQILILNNPTASACTIVYAVDLARSGRTQQWHVEPLAENASISATAPAS